MTAECYRHELAQRDHRITELCAQVAALEAQLADRERVAAPLQEALQEKTGLLEATGVALDRTKNALDLREMEVGEMQHVTDVMRQKLDDILDHGVDLDMQLKAAVLEIAGLQVCPIWRRGGGGSTIFRNFAISSNFPHLFRDCCLLVDLACLSVPCVSPVQKCCSLRLREVWLWHRNFPAISRNFPAVFRNFSQLGLMLPDRIPPFPQFGVVFVGGAGGDVSSARPLGAAAFSPLRQQIGAVSKPLRPPVRKGCADGAAGPTPSCLKALHRPE